LSYQEALNQANYNNLIIPGVVPDACFSSLGYYLFLFLTRFIKQKKECDLFQDTNPAEDFGILLGSGFAIAQLVEPVLIGVGGTAICFFDFAQCLIMQRQMTF
jgi:hypothetical protein